MLLVQSESNRFSLPSYEWVHKSSHSWILKIIKLTEKFENVVLTITGNRNSKSPLKVAWIIREITLSEIIFGGF